MIATILVSSTIIVLILVAYVKVEALAKSYAERHPEQGPYREKHGTCCGMCPRNTCSHHED